jgi:hypothetical protein
VPATRPWFAIPQSIAAWLLGALMAAPLIGLAVVVALWGFDARTDVVIGKGAAGLVFFLLAVYVPIALAAGIWLPILLQRQDPPTLGVAWTATLVAVFGLFLLKVAKSPISTGSAAYVVLTLIQWVWIAVTPGMVLHLASMRDQSAPPAADGAVGSAASSRGVRAR